MDWNSTVVMLAPVSVRIIGIRPAYVEEVQVVLVHVRAFVVKKR